MSQGIESMSKVIKKGGSIFLVIGENITRAGDDEKEIQINTSKIIQEIGVTLGLKVNDVIPITVTQENRRHTKNSITQNDIIWLTA